MSSGSLRKPVDFDQALSEALDRLGGTRISTNIRIGEDEEQYDTFGLIDGASIRRKHGLDGRLMWCEVKISDWIFDIIRAREVLTLPNIGISSASSAR